MNWKRGTTREGSECAYHLVSEPRGYTICKVTVMGEVFYEAWLVHEMLATRLPSADAAKAVCNRAENP